MKLTPKHLLLIQYLADPLDRRTKIDKSKAAGFAELYVFQLLRNKVFLAALHEKTTEMVAAHRPRIYSNLLRDSDNSDTQASIAFLKGCGDIQGGVNVHTNVVQSNTDESFKEDFEEAQAAREAEAIQRKRASLVDSD
jgi:hypothetical protein